MKKEDKKLFLAGGLGGLIGALCCVGPVIIVLLGLGSVSLALSIGKYTWLFISFALLFFCAAVIIYLRKKSCCSIDGIKKNYKVILLSFILLSLLLIFFKYYVATMLAKIAYR